MKKNLCKHRILRVDATSYRQLCAEILQRDGWRCQGCGGREQLQVHHRQFRSRGGSDSPENLITLCVHCHEAVHDRIRD